MKRIGDDWKIARSMRADHAELDRLFDRVVVAMKEADLDRVRERWLELDQRLEQHLTAEEEFIFPRFERSHPATAARLRDEHREIRAALVELGVDLDLHSLCEETATRFIDGLRRHAAFEDTLVYPWAEEHLDGPARLSLLERIRRHRAFSRESVGKPVAIRHG